jgi:uncharacterized protein (DUF885 family)
MDKTCKIIVMIVVLITLISGCELPKQTVTIPTPTIYLSHTPIPAQPTATKLPLQSDLATDLMGLDFDSFIEMSYQRLLSRDPELVLELGLSRVYKTPTDQLTDISDAYIRQTQALEADILDLLHTFDHSSLSTDQQLTYDIYSWYLSDRVEGHAFMYDDYPINPTVLSIHADLLQWFTDLRPLNNLQDAQDYISCLSQVDTKFAQLIDGLKRREEKGVMLPNFLIYYLITEVNEIANSAARSTPYFKAFENKIQGLDTLTYTDKDGVRAPV